MTDPTDRVALVTGSASGPGKAIAEPLPTTIDNAGVFTGGADQFTREWVAPFRPMKRMGTLEDLANAAEYLAGDLSAFVSGQHLLLSGGAHI